MKLISKEKDYYFFLHLFVFFTSLNFYSCKLENLYPTNSDTVAIINGTPVQVGEFMIVLRQNKSLVFDGFDQRTDTVKSVSDEVFWNSDFNGVKPIDKLKERTMQRLIKIKIEQQLAREQKIIGEFNYSMFLEFWKNENKRRKEMIYDNRVIYGPIQYDLDFYYEYFLNDLVTRLKEKLQEKEILVTHEMIQEFYAANKEKYKVFDLSKGLFKASSKDMGYLSFEEVKNNITNQLINQQFDYLVNNKVRKTIVVINHKVYDLISYK